MQFIEDFKQNYSTSKEQIKTISVKKGGWGKTKNSSSSKLEGGWGKAKHSSSLELEGGWDKKE